MKDLRTVPQRPDPETLIEWEELHDTHRTGIYKGWLIVQPYDAMDCDILCYTPSAEWEDASFPDLDYLKDYYTPEWEAGTLHEAIEFVDCYDIDD